MRAFALALALFALAPAARAADAPPLGTLREIALPLFQQKALGDDAPIAGVTLDGNEGKLYIAGKTSVWVWRLADESLRRIRLVQDGDGAERLAAFTRDPEGNLYAVSDQALYVVQNTEGGRHARVRLDPAQTDNVRHLAFARGVAWWVTPAGLHAYDPKHHRVRLAHAKDFVKPGDHVAHDADARRLWVARQRSVIERDLTDPQASRVVHKGQDHIVGLALHAGGVLAVTPKAVLSFGGDGALRQAVPVEGARAIAAAALAPKAHAYWYDDGMIEVLDPATGQARKFAAHDRVARAPGVLAASRDHLAALMPDGTLRVFQMSP